MGVIVFYLIFMVLMIVAMWKMFAKAGKPGWAAIVPIYNFIVMLEVAKKPLWWIILIFLVPIVNIIFFVMMLNGISKSFGKSEGFTVGLFLLFPIFIMILGFGPAKYIEEVKE